MVDRQPWATASAADFGTRGAKAPHGGNCHIGKSRFPLRLQPKQFVFDFSRLFFGEPYRWSALFQPCRPSSMSVPNHPAGGSSSQDSASAQSFSLFQPRAHGNIVAAELNTEASEVFREGACIM